MKRMSRLLQSILCRFNFHPKLDVIQTFGSAQHIGCPYCRREYGIHHGMRAIIPWDSELADMYQVMGFDVKSSTDRWYRYAATPVHSTGYGKGD